jgi:hypothetical protein
MGELSPFILSVSIDRYVVIPVLFVSFWGLCSASLVSLFVLVLSQILYFVVLKFLECLLYILVDHIQCHLYKILINYLKDFFFQSVLVGFFGFFGIVYLCFVGVWIWASVFFISLWFLY